MAIQLARALRVKASVAWQEARKVADPLVSLAHRLEAEITERNAGYLERLFCGGQPAEADVIAAAVAKETRTPWGEEVTKEDLWAQIPPKAP